MKKLNKFYALLITLLVTGCFDEKYEQPPQMYYIIGIYHNDSKTIISDDHQIFVILNTDKIPLNKDSRVIVYFTFEKMEADTAQINITNMLDISAPLVYVNDENRDSFSTNYAIDYSYMWIGQDYLTIFFIFWRENETKVHKFFLSMDPEDQQEDEEKIYLKFHHQTNTTVAKSYVENVISVNINELKNIYSDKDSVELSISFPRTPTPDNAEKFIEHTIWYKYGLP